MELTLPDGQVLPLPALPLSLDGERMPLRRGLPAPGEHHAEIMAELGWVPAGASLPVQ